MRAIALFALLVVILAGCLQNPVDDEIYVMGDSIVWQSVVHAEADPNRPAGNYEWHAAPGAQYSHLIDRADHRANDKLLSPEIALIILGTNDAEEINGDGWSAQDEANWDNLVLDTFHDDTCVVVVLPWMGPGMRASLVAELSEARPYMANLAAQRAAQGHPTVTLDAQSLPVDIIDEDGIHLAYESLENPIPTEEVARVRLALYWDGINQCREIA